MPNANSKRVMKVIAALSVVLFLLLVSIGVDYLLVSWPNGAARPGKGTDYFLLYFGLLWCFLLSYGSRISRWAISKQFVVGAIVGYMISIISVIVASYLAFVNPIERLTNSVEQHGLMLFVGITIAVACWKAILLGGWFFGLASIPLLAIFQGRIKKLFNRGTPFGSS